MNSPLDSLASELNRALMSGGRLPVPGDPTKRVPGAKLTGQELAAPVGMSNSVTVELIGSSGGADVVKVGRDSNLLVSAFQNAQKAQAALDTAIGPLMTPVWTLEPTELTIGDPVDLNWTAPDATAWPVRPFGSALEGEITGDDTKGGPSVEVWRHTRKDSEPLAPVDSAAVPPANWRYALCVTFSARTDGTRIELTGASQAERQLLDEFYQSTLVDWTALDIAGVAADARGADSNAQITTYPVAFPTGVTIVRANLSREARPPQTALMVMAAAALSQPYMATWDTQKKDFVRLLELAGVTNRGGYFISGATGPGGLANVNLTLKLAIVVTTSPTAGADKHFPWPTWANAIALQRNGDAGVTAWDAIRFFGNSHLQARPTAPAGSAAFAWRVTVPKDRPLALLGDQKHDVIMKLAGDKAPKISAAPPLPGKRTMTIGEARKALRERMADPEFTKQHTAQDHAAMLDSVHGFNGLAQMLDFEMYGILRDGSGKELLFSGDETIPAPPDENPWQEQPPQAPGPAPALDEPVHPGSMPTVLIKTGQEADQPVAADAPATKLWTNRFVQMIPMGGGTPKPYDASPYKVLARYSAISVTAGYRDLYGNRLSPGRLVPLMIPLHYTDPLIAPRQWPGCALLAYYDATGKQWTLGMSYMPLGQSPGAKPPSPEAKQARIDCIRSALTQIEGVDGDVKATVSVDFFDYQGTPMQSASSGDITEKLQKFLQVISDGNGDKNVIQTAPIPLQATLFSSQPKIVRMEVNITISRANTYLPNASQQGDLDNSPNRYGVFSIASSVPFGIQAQLDQTKPVPPVTPVDIGKEIEAGLPAGWNALLAYRKDITAHTQYWLIPRDSFPTQPTHRNYWTIRPWNTQLGSGTFPIPTAFYKPVAQGSSNPFDNYKAVTTSFKARDYDILARTALVFLARLSLETGASSKTALGDLLQAMDALAQVLSTATPQVNASLNVSRAFLVPLLDQAPDGNAAKATESAREVLLDAVRTDLAAFYQVSTIIQYEFSPKALDPSIHVFYGTVQPPTYAQNTPAAQPFFSDFEVQNVQPSYLAFSYDLPPGQGYTSYPIKSLSCVITDIQLKDAENEAANEEFALGSWLKLLTPAVIPLITSPTIIPSITRQYPDSPEIGSCTLNAIPADKIATAAPLNAAQFVALTPTVNIDFPGSQNHANDKVNLLLRFNPDIVAAPRFDAEAVAAGWTWASDLHVLLTLSAMNEFFYVTTAPTDRSKYLDAFLPLAKIACQGLKDQLSNTLAMFAAAALPADLIESLVFDVISPQDPNNYAVTGDATTGMQITRTSPRYLTPQNSGGSPIWAVKPTLTLVRNSTVQTDPAKPGQPANVNSILTYTTESVSLPDFVWPKGVPRVADPVLQAWEVDAGDQSKIGVRIQHFLTALLGDPARLLDCDLDIVFSHVFPLDDQNTMITKNVLHPITVTQGHTAQPDVIGGLIAGVVNPIPKPATSLRWVELEVKLRRHSSIISGSAANPARVDATMLVFHERFWFRF